MKIGLNILFVFLSFSIAFGQDHLFPVAKNGKWGLVDTNANFILKYKYDYVEYYPTANKFIYNLNGKKGIINADGKVFSEPIYEDVILFDSVWTSTRESDKWNLSTSDKLFYPHKFDSVVYFSKNILLLYEADKLKIFHTQERKESDSPFLRVSMYNENILLGFTKDDLYHVFNSENLKLISKNANAIDYINYNTVLISGKKKQLLDVKTFQFIGKEMDEIKNLYSGLFFCKNEGEKFVYLKKREHYYPAPDLDYASLLSFPRMSITKSGKKGIWDLSKERFIVPVEFEAITRVNSRYIVGTFGKFGVLNLAGEEIIPQSFESIDAYDNFFVVKKESKYGLISLQGEEIVPPEYTRIRVYNSSVKCYSKKGITIVQLDENGAFKSKKTYKEYMQISIEKERLPRQRSVNMNFGSDNGNPNQPTYEKYGWFRPIIERMVNDTLKEFRGKWGLKDTVDSIAIRPKYAEITMNDERNITKAHFIKTYISSVKRMVKTVNLKNESVYSFSKSTTGIYDTPFQLVDNEARKLISPRAFLAVNMADFQNYYYTRAFENKPILIDPNGDPQLQNISYYGNYQEDILCVCIGGERILTPSRTSNSVCESMTYLYNTGAKRVKIDPLEKFMEIKNGNWYYFDAKGRQLNDEPFQHAKEFKHNLAIVKSNNKWGVIDTAMQVIIPFEYQKLERIIVDGKSFFKVSKGVKNNYLYNKENGNISRTNISRIDHFYNGKWLAQKKGSKKWGLIDTNLTEFTDFKFDYVFPYSTNGFANVIKLGKKTVIDENGTETIPYYKSKKLIALGFDRYGVVTSRGTMVVNLSGDTLLKTEECKKVLESNADYLMYEIRGRQIKLLNLKSDAVLPKKSIILSYSLKDEIFFIQLKGKKRLYSIVKEEFISKDLPNIISIGEGTMIYKSEDNLLGFISFTGDTLCPPKFDKLENIKNGWAMSRGDGSRGPVYTNGESVFKDVVFRIKKLDDNFTFITRDGMGLMTPNGDRIIIPNLYQKIERYNSIFYKAYRRNNTCDLYTLEGEKANDKPYKDIKALDKDALIVKHEGFDYLYSGYLNKSLSFQNIRPFSSKLFILDESRHVGLFDATGALIIPIQYHKIEVVKKQFQVRFFNSFGYFNKKGERLADPYYKHENTY